MDLMLEGVRKGSVEVMERDGMTFVALEDVMARLAFAPSQASGGFVVTYSGRKIHCQFSCCQIYYYQTVRYH